MDLLLAKEWPGHNVLDPHYGFSASPCYPMGDLVMMDRTCHCRERQLEIDVVLMHDGESASAGNVTEVDT